LGLDHGEAQGCSFLILFYEWIYFQSNVLYLNVLVVFGCFVFFSFIRSCVKKLVYMLMRLIFARCSYIDQKISYFCENIVEISICVMIFVGRRTIFFTMNNVALVELN
jgi:hypothetical protein